MNKKDQIDQLYKLKKEVEKSDHTLLVGQINEVIKKVYKDKRIISFIGHFSSGKSSLINHLLGEDILPSSPVPTTSNSAQITIAEQEEIIVNLEKQEYAVVTDYDAVKKINTENQRIESVEVRKTSQDLPLGLTLQDTPGIDATFSNHEANTMKYLLTSDVIVYTVEYNHVESEKNFKEMKRLNSLGMPLIFVINQIDKHDENEISLTDFEASIRQNLDTWGIEVENMLFTSIYPHELNQVNELKALLFSSDLVAESHETFFDRITHYITTEQLAFLQAEQQGILDELELDASSIESQRAAILETQSLTEEQALFETAESTENYFLASIRSILKNAYLIPFEIREEIKTLLEVYSPDYKVGGFFGKDKKRQEIRNQQMTAVLSDLNDSIDKQVNFHIRALYDQHAKYTSGEWLHEIRHYTFALQAEDLVSLMNNQAMVTQDYVLNYTDQLKKYVEQAVVRENRPYIEMFIKNLNVSKLNPAANESADLLARYDMLNELIDSLTTENYRHYYIHVDESIDRLIDRTKVTLELMDQQQIRKQERRQLERKESHLEEAVKQLETFSQISYFSDMTARLHKQLARIQHDVTRIVVFGAFSAGKSSLINALLGDHYLISSPNPTTAAITELSYGHTHQVKFKSVEMLLNELNKIGRTIGIEADDVDTWLRLYNKQQPELDHQFKKFIEALNTNYAHYLPVLREGSMKEIQDDEIEMYSAVDSHSAFVDRLYLQYEIDFLKDKVIIDSPGIGSTNMRHTNETTEIIADSDLLIYVSYFNHVFTENDKQFIKYLADLQILSADSETFYVINATDLARSEAELEQVRDYFDSELSQLNVDSALFGVSSKQALVRRDEQFNEFVAAIQHFADVDSRQQKMTQFENGVKQLEAQAQYIVSHAEEARREEAARRTYYAELKKEPPFIPGHVQQGLDKVQQELNEQLTFMKDRFRIQLYDLIKIYFNKRQVDESGYIGELANKLEDEGSMIVPRLNYIFNQSLINQTAVIRQTLAEQQLIVALDDIRLLPVGQQYMDARLEPLKIKVTNRNLSRKESLEALYEAIHAESMTRLEEKLQHFSQIIKTALSEREPEVAAEWDTYNEELMTDIAEREQHIIDETVVNEIRQVMEGSYASMDR
ncbi:dynamin family protein [Macrococcus bovicus]|uniref:dynamin family protein n=1 Tax=Macrococcus bovicus TaxID=69968 RepID=UPI0025A53A76|nr:dynamin family protein [Macrococcus bovicus]WJP96823.1 dynamin family protein [Macrococcus bovicus]